MLSQQSEVRWRMAPRMAATALWAASIFAAPSTTLSSCVHIFELNNILFCHWSGRTEFWLLGPDANVQMFNCVSRYGSRFWRSAHMAISCWWKIRLRTFRVVQKNSGKSKMESAQIKPRIPKVFTETTQNRMAISIGMTNHTFMARGSVAQRSVPGVLWTPSNLLTTHGSGNVRVSFGIVGVLLWRRDCITHRAVCRSSIDPWSFCT